jgi:hypothetical protein
VNTNCHVQWFITCYLQEDLKGWTIDVLNRQLHGTPSLRLVYYCDNYDARCIWVCTNAARGQSANKIVCHLSVNTLLAGSITNYSYSTITEINYNKKGLCCSSHCGAWLGYIVDCCNAPSQLPFFLIPEILLSHGSRTLFFFFNFILNVMLKRFSWFLNSLMCLWYSF